MSPQPKDQPLLGVVRAIFQYRSLITSRVRREFQLRSARAMWGSAWLVIQPAIQILLYTVIFSEVLRARLPGVGDRLGYGLFLCAGVIHWNYFAELVTRSQTLFLDNVELVKTVRVPRSTLPVALLLSSSVNYAIVTTIFLLVLLVTGRWPGLALLWALPLLGIQVLLALGIGVLTGTVNVFFRDVGHAVAALLQLWFWLTPIVYPLSIVPEQLHRLYAWNPLTRIMLGYQEIVLTQSTPQLAPLVPLALAALALAIIAWWVFRALSTDIVDEL